MRLIINDLEKACQGQVNRFHHCDVTRPIFSPLQSFFLAFNSFPLGSVFSFIHFQLDVVKFRSDMASNPLFKRLKIGSFKTQHIATT